MKHEKTGFERFMADGGNLLVAIFGGILAWGGLVILYIWWSIR